MKKMEHPHYVLGKNFPGVISFNMHRSFHSRYSFSHFRDEQFKA